MATAAEISEYDTEELERQLGETRRELFNLRFQLATGQLDNFSRMSHVKRDVARMLTELRKVIPSFLKRVDLDGRGVAWSNYLATTQAAYLCREGWDMSLVTFRFQEEIWRDKLVGVPVELVPRRHWLDFLPLGGRLGKLKRRARRAEPFFSGVETILAHNSASAAMLGHMPTAGVRAWYCHEAPWRQGALVFLAESGG